mmetsp:Transcript_46084/g.85837  ORF Transcript_46084/g.85837 Transcript_46084/m.85837 type:complete len:220 (-) Transcript_46084:470-1129(-)
MPTSNPCRVSAKFIARKAQLSAEKCAAVTLRGITTATAQRNIPWSSGSLSQTHEALRNAVAKSPGGQCTTLRPPFCGTARRRSRRAICATTPTSAARGKRECLRAPCPLRRRHRRRLSRRRSWRLTMTLAAPLRCFATSGSGSLLRLKTHSPTHGAWQAVFRSRRSTSKTCTTSTPSACSTTTMAHPGRPPPPTSSTSPPGLSFGRTTIRSSSFAKPRM